jgi:hypothetical protein
MQRTQGEAMMHVVRFVCCGPAVVGRMLWHAAFCDAAPPFAWIWMMPFMLLLAPFALVNLAVHELKRRKADQPSSPVV